MNNNDPQAELATWKAVRHSYPGWLVVPYRNRFDLLWESAQSLQHGLAHSLTSGILPDWPAETRLEAWFELNWRMERALMPLPPGWVSKIETTLAEIAPCGELIEVAPAFFCLAAREFTCRSDLRQPWIALALAVLRHHREFRHTIEFQTWHTRLAPLDADWDELHHQRAYQLALWHLTFMDDAQALNAVEAWTAERGRDPYWLTRKGGLLAELGESDKARALLEECLRRLQGFSPDAAPFFGTSRESAVRSIFQLLPKKGRKTGDRESADRLRALSNIDGWGYWEELQQPASGPIDLEGRLPWRPLSGVQRFRLGEELGSPLRVQNGGGTTISPMTNALADSFADLALASEDLAGTSLLRLRSDDFWKKRLDAAHMARLPDGLLTDLRTACDNAWQQVEKLHSRSSQAQATVYRACGLLRQLYWRMEGGEIAKWFARLLSLGSHEVFRGNFRNAQPLREALKDLAGCIETAQVMDVIAEALAFPLPEEADVEERFWPDPLEGLRLPPRAGLVLPESALRRIGALIDRAPTSRSALFSLAWLAEVGLLPRAAAETLASKLWEGCNILPDISPLPPSDLLVLPAPAPHQPQNALAEWFLKSPPPDLRQPSGGISLRGREWFSELSGVSKHYRRADAPFVQWNSAQADTLLKHTEAWWAREGKELLNARKGLPFADSINHRLYWLRFALARAIAPNLTVGSDAGKNRLPRLLDDIEECGYPVLSVRPLLLRFKVGDAANTADRLIDGLRSRDRDSVLDALWGVIHWCEFKKEAKLPALPHRLIEQLLIFLAARADGEDAANVVGTIEAILEHEPDILSNRAKELLELALDALQGRATYPETWHQDYGTRYDNTVELRTNAVRLAAAIHRAGISEHEAVQDWLELGRTDPLTIVREALKV